MSSSAFVVPHDPKAPSSAVTGVDAAQTWATAVAPSDKVPKVGTTRIFYNTPAGKTTAISSLSDKYSSNEVSNVARRELLRKSVASGIKAVKALDSVNDVAVDAALDPHASAVAAHLALYQFSLKTKPPSRFNPNLTEAIAEKLNLKPIQPSEEWDRGVVYSYSQNLARTLTELPANMMTPTKFCDRVKSEFAGVPNVEIIVRDEAWAEAKGMHTFLSVTHGTSEPAKLLEIHYKGGAAGAQPLAFVGKGITFDSGGISLKPAKDMKLMRGDMGGAAAVVSSALAIAKMKLPINLVAVTPLTENMPGPSATKPGDIIYAMNGKTVEVDNTDAEGRLVLADALYYTSSEFKPHTLIDVATLTGGMCVALGEVLTGVFTNSNGLWDKLYAAGEHEYDRFWRMPLEDDYLPQIDSSNADLCNTGGVYASSCTAALFLREFTAWAHVDIAGTMEATRPSPYQEKGMTGRPVRALIEYARRLN
ncbi:leucine aminopeptidase [Mycena floridula]|nr:leucine aminopeptidase [Mycena floridula]